VEDAQRAHQRGLRLDRDHTGLEAAEGGDAVAHVRPGVEYEVAGAHEARVEPLHGGTVLPVAVVDEQRAGDAAGGPQAVEQRHGQAGAPAADGGPDAPSAGSASASGATGAAGYSRTRPIPRRLKASLQPRHAVTAACAVGR